METTKSFKSERAAKLYMTKLEKRYNALRTEKCEIAGKARETGWSDEAFAAERAKQVEIDGAYEAMEAHRAACKAIGWYISCWTLRFNESPTRALIAANMD